MRVAGMGVPPLEVFFLGTGASRSDSSSVCSQARCHSRFFENAIARAESELTKLRKLTSGLGSLYFPLEPVE